MSIWGASRAGGAQLTLSWVDTSNVEAGYKIERALACGTFTQVAIVGANVTRYVDPGLADSTLYCYRLRAYNAAGHSPYSAVVSATTRAVTPSLAISSQPDSQTVTVGSNVSFTVTATSTAPLTYRWRKNGTNIVGATAATYSISNVQTTHAGLYSVLISNSVGIVTSANATLTVTAAPVAPAITTQPVARTVTIGSSTSFSVTASGTGPLTYQWRRNGTNIVGATSAMYSLSNVQTSHAGAYSVVVGNSVGSMTSANAALTVTAVAPAITSQPVARTVTVGSSTSFSVTASGTGPLTYQWRKNGTNIVGATSAIYSLSNVQTTHAGAYSVRVANSAGSVISANAALIVTAPPLVAPGGLAAMPGNAQVTLSWSAVSGATGYNVKRATGSGGPYTTVATGVTATGYTNTGLVNGTVYYYVVSAVYAGVESPNSAAVSTTPGGLPSPWQTRDIGAVGVAGAASVSGGSYTVKGSGADIGGTADAFHFLHQVGTGNCEIRARVVTMPTGARAGVMIRESLNADARHAFVALTTANGVLFQQRSSTAGSTAITSAAGWKAPYWVRVVRGGDIFTAMHSNDGNTWSIIGSATIPMGTSVSIGLAVTGTSGLATFDGLQVTP